MKTKNRYEKIVPIFIMGLLIGIFPNEMFGQNAFAANVLQKENKSLLNSENNSAIPLKAVLSEAQKAYNIKFVYEDDIVSDVFLSNEFLRQGSEKQLIDKLSAFLGNEGIGISALAKKQYALYRKTESTDAATGPSVVNPPNEIHISGTVRDELGETLAGVTIVVKGTSNGVITDGQGRFELDVDPTDSLLVSFVGYESRTIGVRNRSDIAITLTAESGSLNEVVVVAYGEQKKESVTGSIASIKTKELVQSPAANLAVSLAGRLPGLTSIQTSGEPGANSSLLYLRGRGTINGQAPIILVDGVERPLEFIDPHEVDNVTILKDASATALYGVRGANGVILVTTRRGQKGQDPQINFSAQYGIQQFTDHPETVDALTWAKLANQAAINDGRTDLPYSDFALEQFEKGGNPLYPDIDYWDMLVRKFVPQQRYDLNVSGSNSQGTFRYFVNAGVLDQSGQWKLDKKKYENFKQDFDPSSYLKRYNFRSNIDVDLTSSLKALLNVAGYLEKVNSPNAPTSQIFAGIADWAPVRPGPVTPEGEVLTWDGNNQPDPYASINRKGYIQSTRSHVLSTFGLEQNLDFLTEGLSVKLLASFDTRSVYNLTANRDFEDYLPEVIGDSLVGYRKRGGDNTPLSLSTGTSFQSKTNFQLFIEYMKAFGPEQKHAVSGLLFGQKEERIEPGDRIPFNLIGTSGRFTYGYDSRYFFEFNAGYNGSEQFAKGNRFGFFPAVSAGWLVSNEKFFASKEVISHLKLRTSYGEVGNDQLGGRRFLYLDDVHRAGGGYSSSLLGTVSESFKGNPNIKWEVAKKTNLGIEVGLFNQVSLNADWFWEERDNVLIDRSASAPILNGLALNSLPPVNTGRVKNKGYEIELDYQKAFAKDLLVQAKLNFNHAKNKIIYVGEVPFPEDYAYQHQQEGYSIGQFWGARIDGYFNTQKELDAAPVYAIGASPRVGDFKYKDLNGDGIIDDKDAAPIGYTHVPEYTFGGSFSIQFKNLDFSFLLQGVSHVSTNLIEFGGLGILEQENFYINHVEAWTEERYHNNLHVSWPALSRNVSSSEIVPNDFFNVNSSYLRLKNAEIGYSLPNRWIHKIFAKEIRVYANGLNLWTWDRMPFKGYDPEIRGSVVYPNYKVINFGIDFTF